MRTTTSSHTIKDPTANARTLANQALDLLRRDILSGTLAPGLRLRTKELQASYGLGLSPLRESLQRLSAEGMVVNDAQRGFAVAAVTVAPVIAVGREAARAHHRVEVGMEEQLPRLRCATPS